MFDHRIVAAMLILVTGVFPAGDARAQEDVDEAEDAEPAPKASVRARQRPVRGGTGVAAGVQLSLFPGPGPVLEVRPGKRASVGVQFGYAYFYWGIAGDAKLYLDDKPDSVYVGLRPLFVRETGKAEPILDRVVTDSGGTLEYYGQFNLFAVQPLVGYALTSRAVFGFIDFGPTLGTAWRSGRGKHTHVLGQATIGVGGRF